MGSRCLLVILVRGNMRLPVPPARTTPFIAPPWGKPCSVGNAFKSLVYLPQMLITESAIARVAATVSQRDRPVSAALFRLPFGKGDPGAPMFGSPTPAQPGRAG